MPHVHPMLPQANHDELAAQKFIVALKTFTGAPNGLGKVQHALYEKEIAPAFQAAHGRLPKDRHELRREMEKQELHQFWSGLMRVSQEMMWDRVADTVDRNRDAMNAKAKAIANPKGSVRTNPDMEIPRYLTGIDTHIMPGSYFTDTTEDDLRAGMMVDLGGAVYMMNRNGGGMNDGRGHTLVAHVKEFYPDFKPKRILDMGCAAGCSTLVWADAYPDAEIYAIDIGAPVVRYAHARAEYLNKAVHFSQQNAEATDFEDGFFDIVVSHVMLHETSNSAVPRIFAECKRLLAPGGIMAHMEVPARWEDTDLPTQVMLDWQSYYNGEPFWGRILGYDLKGLSEKLGFTDLRAGYHTPPGDFRTAKPGSFSTTKTPKGFGWYVVSGRAPA